MQPIDAPPRTGVEVEFAGLDAHAAAHVIASAIGGEVEETGRHAALVRDSRLGEVKLVLDTRYAEPARDPGLIDNLLETLDIRDDAAGLLKEVLPIPVEMITRPLALEQFEVLDHAIAALRQAGATGTRGGALHAFGLHLNPGFDGKPERAIRIAATYAFVERHLRHRNPPDMARRLSPFVDPYPEAYVRELAEACRSGPPDLPAFIALYARHNKDRNRGLDMWPLLGWLAPEQAGAAHGKPILKPRAAFHYRLPDSLVGDAEWSPRADLERWLAIERAADDPAAFERLRMAASGLAAGRISRAEYFREVEAVLG